jgi:hypothetical protein
MKRNTQRSYAKQACHWFSGGDSESLGGEPCFYDRHNPSPETPTRFDHCGWWIENQLSTPLREARPAWPGLWLEDRQSQSCPSHSESPDAAWQPRRWALLVRSSSQRCLVTTGALPSATSMWTHALSGVSERGEVQRCEFVAQLRLPVAKDSNPGGVSPPRTMVHQSAGVVLHLTRGRRPKRTGSQSAQVSTKRRDQKCQSGHLV